MPAFGATLGKDAVGVYASDKPSASSINPSGLRPDARSLLQRANDAYHATWGEDMSPAALAGFSAAWAFFTDVLPSGVLPRSRGRRRGRARDRSAAREPAERQRAAASARPDTPNAGDNVAAASVIWEWVAPG